MMQVTDVRIGNILKWKSYGRSGFSEVNMIENRPENKTPFRTPIFQLMSGSCDHECEPILIDDKWLMKLGFDNKKGYLELKTFTGYLFTTEFIKESFLITMVFDGNHIPLYNIKFVHQLQNLYCSIVGEELSVVNVAT